MKYLICFVVFIVFCSTFGYVGYAYGENVGTNAGYNDGYTQGFNQGDVHGKQVGGSVGYRQGYNTALSSCINYPFLLLDTNVYVACKRITP